MFKFATLADTKARETIGVTMVSYAASWNGLVTIWKQNVINAADFDGAKGNTDL